MTKHREALLRILQEADRHMTADEIYIAAKETNSGISKATVYRNLSELVRTGVLEKTRVGLSGSLYECKRTYHQHTVCEKCGRVVDVDLGIDTQAIANKIPGTVIKELKVIVRCICAECNE